MSVQRLTSTCVSCVAKANLDKHPVDITEQQKIEYMQRMLSIVANAKSTDSAPLIVHKIDQLRTELFGASTDFTEIKRYFNDYVMQKECRILADIDSAEDSLLRGLQYSMTGNYIDFGTLANVSEDKFEELLLKAKEIYLDTEEYEALKKHLSGAKRLVVLHDNCGEIVFDHLLIKTLKKLYPELQITSMVRGFPVLNDATMDDAEQIGLTKTVNVIGNGTNIAGTCMDEISKEALEILEAADVIISKGQGNFETLYGCGLNIYYLFMCKCTMFANRFKKNLYEGMLLNDKNV